ncbi:phage major capsid protein, partial [Parasutterella excrementihominis]|uniref:phage major capsid protein n=1 Tax=Parasutterella excrementihominis TaxID=487175 RepID=UPI0022E58647
TYWLAENTAPTESNATFDKVPLKPKTIGALSSVSRNLLLQSSMNVEAFVRNELAVSLALGIDLAALCGTGTNNQPTGIANMSGICTVEGGTNGGSLTFDKLIDMETQVATANADVTNMYYLCNAATIGFLKKIKNTSGDYIWKPITEAVRNGFPGEVNGYAVGRSNQVRSGLEKGTSKNCHEIYFGNWADLLIGEWGFLEIDVNRYGDAWKSGGVEIRALQTIDIAVRHPKSFCLFSDALLS